MKITMHDEFNGDIKIDVKNGVSCNARVFEKGGMICNIAPWSSSGCPIMLEICITPNGEILHRGWSWSGPANSWLHTQSDPKSVEATAAMVDTVSGLFSGRIKIDGIKIGVGATVQDICHINVAAEEAKCGHRIFLA